MQTKRTEPVKRSFVRFGVVTLFLVFVVSAPAFAQQPFVTDDTDTTPRHHFHFEFSNEYDVLQRSSFPNLKQNTADFEVDYGLFETVEIGIEVPIITLTNSPDDIQRRVTGNGDANFSLKYNFHREKKESRWPALTISMNVELPTGSVKRQLGSGLADYYINGVLQKHLSNKNILGLNGGLLLSGNETTELRALKLVARYLLEEDHWSVSLHQS
ncbi:MAG: hypothetical protein C5B55_03835 [Blastocatellia bacterium]|nr:MAG: hypothetical protein C5B55_03835 [Blastocatellia bacterium]